MTSVQKDYELALEKKVEANGAFKNKDYKLALKLYSKIFIYIGMSSKNNEKMKVPKPRDPNFIKQEDIDKELEEERKQNIFLKPENELTFEDKKDILRSTIYNNMAACYFQLKNYRECRDNCRKVLNANPEDTKALLRLTKSFRHLGYHNDAYETCKKLVELLKDKPKLLKVAQNEMKIVKKSRKEANEKYKSHMFKNIKKQQQKDRKKYAKEEKDRLDKFYQEHIKCYRPSNSSGCFGNFFYEGVEIKHTFEKGNNAAKTYTIGNQGGRMSVVDQDGNPSNDWIVA